MINPETLDLSSLPAIPLSDRRNLPTTIGIYFAISNGEVQKKFAHPVRGLGVFWRGKSQKNLAKA